MAGKPHYVKSLDMSDFTHYLRPRAADALRGRECVRCDAVAARRLFAEGCVHLDNIHATPFLVGERHATGSLRARTLPGKKMLRWARGVEGAVLQCGREYRVTSLIRHRTPPRITIGP